MPETRPPPRLHALTPDRPPDRRRRDRGRAPAPSCPTPPPAHPRAEYSGRGRWARAWRRRLGRLRGGLGEAGAGRVPGSRGRGILERGGLGGVHVALHVAEGDAGAAGSLAAKRLRLLFELGVRYDAIHQVEREGLLGVEDVGGVVESRALAYNLTMSGGRSALLAHRARPGADPSRVVRHVAGAPGAGRDRRLSPGLGRNRGVAGSYPALPIPSGRNPDASYATFLDGPRGRRPPDVGPSVGTALAAEQRFITETNGRYAYHPGTLNVPIGDTVTWTKTGRPAHRPPTASFDSEQFTEGQTFAHTFTTAGTFKYHCDVHSHMHATVIVLAAGSHRRRPTPLRSRPMGMTARCRSCRSGSASASWRWPCYCALGVAPPKSAESPSTPFGPGLQDGSRLVDLAGRSNPELSAPWIHAWM